MKGHLAEIETKEEKEVIDTSLYRYAEGRISCLNINLRMYLQHLKTFFGK